MAFSVNDFRSRLQYDGSRPNLFECSLAFPIPGIANGSSAAEDFTFMCRAAQLPGSTVNPVPVNYFGRELKFAGNRTFTEWTVTIINDENFNIRNAFEIWMNNINSHRFNLRNVNYLSPVDYQKDAFVKHYGKTGNTLKAYRLIGCFPIDISPIELDWAANDMIEEYAVTFSYQWWEQIVADQGADYNVSIY